MANRNKLTYIGNYIIDMEKDIIAKGRRGPIFRCKCKDQDSYFCVKIIYKQQNNEQSEINAFKKLKQALESNINVLRIYDIIEDAEKFCIFTELCNSTFEQYLEERQNSITLNTDEIYSFAGQIVRGYQYLRKQKIIVKDLTLKTILVQKILHNRIILKITDFCINNLNGGSIADSRARTPIYSAPEVFNKSLDQIQQFDSCDIYSFGVILYRMCFKEGSLNQIHDLNELREFHNELKIKPFSCPQNAYCQKELIELIQKMIVYNPDARIQWDQLDLKFPQKFLILKDKFYVDLNQFVGKGAQGETKIAYALSNNEELVCKIIENKNLGTSREIQIFEQIQGKSHENVIKIVDLIKQTQHTYLVMEKCDQSMQKFLDEKLQNGQKLDSKEIIDILYQIVEGYCFLKLLGIIHRDLKPDNIVFKKNEKGRNIVKIIDFGVGKIIGRDGTSTEAGTPIFSAPEVLENGQIYNYQCDIYSLGIILYQMAFLRMIQDFRSKQDVKDFHKRLEIKQFLYPQHQNPLITDLIKKMIVFNPNERITWEQLQAHSIFDEFRQAQMEIYQYIYSLYFLASKLLVISEEGQKQVPELYDEMLLCQQFLIRFQLICILNISVLQQNYVINLKSQNYQVKSIETFHKWLQDINFKGVEDQIKQKYQTLKEQKTTNNSYTINNGKEILKQYVNSCLNDQQLQMNFFHCNNFFNQFFQLIRIQILQSNLQVKLKYYLLKFSRVFEEYPIENFMGYSETKLSLKICDLNKMQQYIGDDLKSLQK